MVVVDLAPGRVAEDVVRPGDARPLGCRVGPVRDSPCAVRVVEARKPPVGVAHIRCCRVSVKPKGQVQIGRVVSFHRAARHWLKSEAQVAGRGGPAGAVGSGAPRSGAVWCRCRHLPQRRFKLRVYECCSCRGGGPSLPRRALCLVPPVADGSRACWPRRTELVTGRGFSSRRRRRRSVDRWLC